jgi:hypothetical protein
MNNKALMDKELTDLEYKLVTLIVRYAGIEYFDAIKVLPKLAAMSKRK